MNIFKRGLVSLVAVATIAGASGAVLAHGGATGIVKERMDLMVSIGKAMDRLTKMFQGEASFDAGDVREAARLIAGHGGEEMTRLFPKDSIQRPSEALPAIWQDWERFTELADELTVYANALAEAADNPRGGPMYGGDSPRGMGLAQGGGAIMGRANPMMGDRGPMSDPGALANMPPDAAFARVTQTCGACHTSFRKKN
jgi:cytochrome c556